MYVTKASKYILFLGEMEKTASLEKERTKEIVSEHQPERFATMKEWKNQLIRIFSN
jgi:hypothetical protein